MKPSPPPIAVVNAGPPRARSAPRAETTSDVTRPRDLVLAALVTALALAASLALIPHEGRFGSPGPLSRPHVQARLACAACHERSKGKGAAGACTGCHGTTAHASTREGHRALAKQGLLRCVDCHPAHGPDQGITLAASGAFVPLVSERACARCHDTRHTGDPAAACFASAAAPGVGPRANFCFDEHQRSDAPSRPQGTVCAAQHGPARFAAWEAARAAATRTPWVRSYGWPVPWEPLGVSLASGVLAFVSLGAARRRRRDRQAPPTAHVTPQAKVRLPQINTSTCVGCYACVDACPFDVLEIDRYVARVARPADCCGVVLCAQVCPNGSLTIDEREPIETGPRLGEHLESLDAPGVYLAGDLSGVPLIKNAILQGRRVIDDIAEKVPRLRGPGDVLDVAIVGAGPAGLSASLRAVERRLRYVTLEQGSIASSIKSFPRNKLVYDPPLDLPIEGELWLKECTKEELLAQWTRIARKRKLAVREGCRVTDVTREPEGHLRIEVVGADGRVETVRARQLVLAIGKRGTPRRLECEVAPEAEAKLFYSLADARSLAGRRVLVVGLGDSAMEAAVALARQEQTSVTMSYRGTSFTRGKARNIAEVRSLVQRGRIRLVFESQVVRIEESCVLLDVGGKQERLGNDVVLAMIGGIASWDLVRKAGVQLGPTAGPPPAGVTSGHSNDS